MKSLYTKQQSYESVTIIVKIESYDNRMFIQISNASHAKIALWPDANIFGETSFLHSLNYWQFRGSILLQIKLQHFVVMYLELPIRHCTLQSTAE